MVSLMICVGILIEEDNKYQSALRGKKSDYSSTTQRDDGEFFILMIN
jgi:hypothetical protein